MEITLTQLQVLYSSRGWNILDVDFTYFLRMPKESAYFLSMNIYWLLREYQ
jgi:hypothetical protein